jgi:hypothetical protein
LVSGSSLETRLRNESGMLQLSRLAGERVAIARPHHPDQPCEQAPSFQRTLTNRLATPSRPAASSAARGMPPPSADSIQGPRKCDHTRGSSGLFRSIPLFRRPNARRLQSVQSVKSVIERILSTKPLPHPHHICKIPQPRKRACARVYG